MGILTRKNMRVRARKKKKGTAVDPGERTHFRRRLRTRSAIGGFRHGRLGLAVIIERGRGRRKGANVYSFVEYPGQAAMPRPSRPKHSKGKKSEGRGVQ